jgi:hypothetical protein
MARRFCPPGICRCFQLWRDKPADTPVFLTKNGHGRYAIVDINGYERLRSELDLMSALAEGEASGRKSGWVDMDSAMKKLGV